MPLCVCVCARSLVWLSVCDCLAFPSEHKPPCNVGVPVLCGCGCGCACLVRAVELPFGAGFAFASISDPQPGPAAVTPDPAPVSNDATPKLTPIGSPVVVQPRAIVSHSVDVTPVGSPAAVTRSLPGRPLVSRRSDAVAATGGVMLVTGTTIAVPSAAALAPTMSPLQHGSQRHLRSGERKDWGGGG